MQRAWVLSMVRILRAATKTPCSEINKYLKKKIENTALPSTLMLLIHPLSHGKQDPLGFSRKWERPRWTQAMLVCDFQGEKNLRRA